MELRGPILMPEWVIVLTDYYRWVMQQISQGKCDRKQVRPAETSFGMVESSDNAPEQYHRICPPVLGVKCQLVDLNNLSGDLRLRRARVATIS